MVGNPHVRQNLEREKGSASSYKVPRIQREDQQWSGGSASRLEYRGTGPMHAASHFAVKISSGECGTKNEGPWASDRVNSILQIANGCSDVERIRSILRLVGNCSDLERTQRILQIMSACSDAERAYLQVVIGIDSSSNRKTDRGFASVPLQLLHNDTRMSLPARPKTRASARNRNSPLKIPNSKKRKEHEDDETDDAIGEGPARPLTQPRTSFRIDDERMVESFIYTRFLQIQQSGLKIMAKTWIKAICPKKQANFPYVDSNPRNDQQRRKPRHDGPPRVPTFWPNLEYCRHREPDHLDKMERTHLLVHLVRLYWNQEDWQQANCGNCQVPILVSVGNWVQFLEESYPPDKLAEVSASSTEQAKQRVQYLRDIYKVAQAEQEYRERAIDGSTTFTFSGDIKLFHPSDMRPRKLRQIAASGGHRSDPVSDLTTPNSAPTPTTTGSTASRRASVDSRASERLQRAPDRTLIEYDMESEKEDDSIVTMASGSAQSQGTTTSEPWMMSAEDMKIDGLIDHGGAPAHRSFKIEPAIEDAGATNRGAYDGTMAQYGDMDTALNHPTMWDGIVDPSMNICADPRTSFSSEMMPLASVPGRIYEQDLGSPDQVIGDRSLRYPKADDIAYDQEHNHLYGSIYSVVQPMNRADRPMHTRPNRNTIMTSERMMGDLSSIEQQQSQFSFGGQPMSDPGQGLMSGVDFAMPMARDGQGYVDDPAAPVSLFQPFLGST